MWRRLLWFIVLMLVTGFRWALADETTIMPTFNLDTKTNGKMDPNSLEIFRISPKNIEFSTETTFKSNKMSSFEDEYSKILDTNINEDNFMKNMDTFSFSGDNDAELILEKLYNLTEKEFSTTKRNLDPTTTQATNSEIPREQVATTTSNPAQKMSTLFLDIEKADSNLVAKSVPLIDESAKDVGTNGLEKDGDLKPLGGVTAQELLVKKNISTKSQAVEPTNTVVTEISVQEFVNGETVQRKPTKEELRILQRKILGSTFDDDKNNDIFAIKDQNDTRNASLSIKNDTLVLLSEIEDLTKMFKTDTAFVDDESDPFGEWSESDDVNDMETILKDNADEFDHIRESNEDIYQVFKKSDDPKEKPSGKNVLEKEPSRDYRKFYHTERKNFSNVKEVKITISETEGDFFDDDTFSGDRPHVKVNIKTTENKFQLNDNTSKLNPESTTTEAVITTTPILVVSSTPQDNITTIDVLQATTTTDDATTTTAAATTQLPITEELFTEFNSLSTNINFESHNVTTALAEEIPTSTVPTFIVADTDKTVVGKEDTSAENGISLKDFSEITENNFEVLKNADILGTRDLPIIENNINSGKLQIDSTEVPEVMTTEVINVKIITASNDSFDKWVPVTEDELLSSTISADIATITFKIDTNEEGSTLLVDEDITASTVSPVTEPIIISSTNNETISTETNKPLIYTNTEATEVLTVTEPTLSISTEKSIFANIDERSFNKEFFENEMSPNKIASMFNEQLEYNEDDDDEEDDEVKSKETDKQNYSELGDKKENLTKAPIWQNHNKMELIYPERHNVDNFDANDFLATLERGEQKVQLVPILRATLLNNSAEFSVKISKKADSFYIPTSAYIKEYDNILNITWKTNENQNNSFAMRIVETDEYYMIKEIITNLFTGNKFVMQSKHVALNPDPTLDESMPGRSRVVMMKDGTYLTISNVAFLEKSLDRRRENSKASLTDPRFWHFEVASICIATVLIIAIVVYVIAIRTKAKIVLREKDELPQVTHC